MAGRRIKEISGRGFSEKGLGDENKFGKYTFIYDLDKLVEGGKKCLEILEKAKNLSKENNVRISDYIPVIVCNFQCIDYGGNYKGGKYNDASFSSSLYYYQLLKIFGLNSDDELDITNPTPEQELEVCKAIIENLGEEYKIHVGV